MLDHIFLFSGASAVGKTSVLRSLIPLLQHKGAGPCVCKIDCLQSEDASVFAEMNLPCVTGLSEDICPDHFWCPICRNCGIGPIARAAILW